jgi:hypothetical protein
LCNAFRKGLFNVTGSAADIEREQAGAQNFNAAIHTSGIVSGQHQTVKETFGCIAKGVDRLGVKEAFAD